MKLLDHTCATAAENLAADEALLDDCEEGGTAVLRFYEPTTPCVVVGYGNRVDLEVNRSACEAAGVPVLRRVSGGGTVVLGPGCLAYAVVLPIAETSALESVTGTNQWIMERNRTALESVVGRSVEIRGHTDLAIEGRKFSGNAQRRRRQAVLFHGTLLLSADLPAIERLLKMPSSQPDYRSGRAHRDFVINLGVPASAVKRSMADVWSAREPWTGSLDGRIEALVRVRYGLPEWHTRA